MYLAPKMMKAQFNKSMINHIQSIETDNIKERVAMRILPTNLVISALLSLSLFCGAIPLASAANIALVVDAKVLRNANWISELNAQTSTASVIDGRNSYAIVAHDEIVLYASEWLPSLESWQLPNNVLRNVDSSNFAAAFEKATSLLRQAPQNTSGNDRVVLINSGQIIVGDEGKQDRFEKWFNLILLPQAEKQAIRTNWISVNAQESHFLSDLARQGVLKSKTLNLTVVEAPKLSTEPVQPINLAQAAAAAEPTQAPEAAPTPESAPTPLATQTEQTKAAPEPQEPATPNPTEKDNKPLATGPALDVTAQTNTMSAPVPVQNEPTQQSEVSLQTATNSLKQDTPANLMSWLILLLLAIAILVVGGFFYFRSTGREQTFSENRLEDPTLVNADPSTDLEEAGDHVPANILAERTATPVAASTMPENATGKITTENVAARAAPVRTAGANDESDLDSTAENPAALSLTKVSEIDMDATAENATVEPEVKAADIDMDATTENAAAPTQASAKLNRASDDALDTTAENPLPSELDITGKNPVQRK